MLTRVRAIYSTAWFAA